MMRRRHVCVALTLSLLTAALAAQAQQGAKVARVGLLALAAPPTGADATTDALLQGLREAGYIEGKNLVIERRYADAQAQRLPELAADLVRREVDVILILGPGPLQAARKATTTIALVMLASSSDPVADGIAASLGRPGGNITGLTYAVSSDRFGKQLELLKLAAGRLARVAVLWDLDVEIYRQFWAPAMAQAGQALGLQVLPPSFVRDAQDLPAAFTAMKRQQADGVLVATGGPLNAARARVAELAIEHRLSTMAAFKTFPQAGLLMSYGPDLPDIYRRGASYVARILQGAKPGDLPIELPLKYELVINRKTANALGLTLPASLLVRADEVIE